MFFCTIKCLSILLIILPQQSQCSLQEEAISRWINDLGNELWNLGKTITKFSEIQGTYAFLNAQVEKKNPEELLKEIVVDIERMMDRKMDAVMCIMEKAEEAAENFDYNNTETFYEYYSSKYSPFDTDATPRLGEQLAYNSAMYLPMKVNKDTHFYNLEVNTSHSSVHVPTNIYDREKVPATAIQWSEALDEVFRQNYNSDPALSWQYFGSTSGIMRHYPAKRWEEVEKDEFDCRIRTWFIEAATCTKDVVLLIDNSGSMDGMGKHIAALTAYSILDTFSNNDYINVMNYSSFTNFTVPCYKDMLVQATEENIQFFKNAISALKPEGKTQLDQALVQAFKLLSSYREARGCSKDSSSCNQAIMLITDGVSRNWSDVVIRHNYLPDGSIPIRIFTYLIGIEVTNTEEIRWISCANRGYYTHVQTLEQVTVSVLQYINVIARPLVLQAVEHPLSWTHAYADLTYDDKKDDQINEPYRLLTSVAVPAFDTKANKDNSSRRAELLGVAATDVPIDDIAKLTLPYKVGVNAYVFIVSNNGYILMHPDLRPVFEGKLTENFNSIDIIEVEQLDNDLPPRVTDDTLLELRQALVNGSKGTIQNVPVKYHYDNMQRVTRQIYDYYFAPISSTPFSIALAFPDKYGDYFLHVGDEISKNRHTGAKITDFFQGSNWKIHPKWVYCRYHYLEGHEFPSPEEEMLHFLGKMYEDDFRWEKQYVGVENGETENLSEVECGRKTHGDDDYYCDRELVQRLVFDAKNTLSAFQERWVYQQGEYHLFERFNATLRFVATMSGLTRWEYISEDIENITQKEFGDRHSSAIDETWYKSAVIQRQYDRESFVYSVPFEKEDDEELLVTGSYAIFPNDAGREAPGSVVGFQFVHANFKRRVLEITSRVSKQCPECGTCDITLNCYIIDNNGYVIIAEDDGNTGRFFGEIEGDIMDSMLNESIFEAVTLYDFQSLCKKPKKSSNNAHTLLTPIGYLRLTFDWFLVKVTWLIFEFSLSELLAPIYASAEEYFGFRRASYIIYQDINETIELLKQIRLEATSETDDSGTGEEFNGDDDDDDEKDKPFLYYPCEKQKKLYILQQHLFLHDNYPIEIEATRPYYLKKIPYSNLLFIAINTTIPKMKQVYYSTTSENIVYENQTVYPCQKSYLNSLFRRRLVGCFNEHPLEKEITTCGRSDCIKINFSLLIIMLLILIRLK